jgi:predicted MFS family arabinose efflux permease
MPIAAILFLTVVNLLNYFDRYIVQAVEPSITKEFGLTNTQAGYVVSAFVLGYFIFSPIFGFLGDRFDRRRVMAFGLVAWSIATAMTSYAAGIVTFVMCRILVGVGEACYGAIVPVYLKGRICDAVQLNRALSIFYVAIPVGSALGYVAGGQIAALYGWRTLFVMAAVPGVLLALGFLMLAGEGLEARPTEVSKASGGFKAGVLQIASAAFIVRHGTTLGLSEAQASTYFGVILVATGLVGTLGGGMLASRLVTGRADTVAGLLSFVTYSTLLGVPFLALCFVAKTQFLFLLGCALAELLIFAGVAPLNSIIVARAPSGYEALTQGVTIFLIQLFGGFLGPVVVGGLADVFGSLTAALQATTVALLLSGLVWWCAGRNIAKPSHGSPLPN